jgi:hypothetical protein
MELYFFDTIQDLQILTIIINIYNSDALKTSIDISKSNQLQLFLFV